MIRVKMGFALSISVFTLISHPVMGQQFTVTDMTPPGTEDSQAYGISSHGLVTGVTRGGDGTTQAFRWSVANGFMKVGSFGAGLWSSASASDANGQVVGGAGTANGFCHAFIFLNGNAMTDLGTLGGNHSSAESINANGQVVGESDAADGTSHAFLWTQAGGMQDLNNLIDPNTGYTLVSASSISHRGSIVCLATQNGQNKGVLLTPVMDRAFFHWL